LNKQTAIIGMNKKNFKLLKNVCWVLAAISMFFLKLGDAQNNALSLTAFVLIIAGIAFNAIEDRK